MKTEYAVGKIRIHFESRARRRRFVALIYAVLLVYAVLAAFEITQRSLSGRVTATYAWIVAGFGILFVALWIVFTWLGGDMGARGDERETHRRDHAHFRAYYVLGIGLVAALFTGFFADPNPIAPLLPLALRTFLIKLPQMLLMDTIFIYITLPQAILLWTEPDMEPEA
jgi:VanZ family protein